jgi:hypothetical protein
VRRILPKIYFAVVFVASCVPGATAQDRMQAAQVAVNNMAVETLECAAYFDIVSLGVVKL